MTRDATSAERTLLHLYREWSENTWAAGFMSPNPDIVKAFRAYLKKEATSTIEIEPYERAFLDEYAKQEQEAPK